MKKIAFLILIATANSNAIANTYNTEVDASFTSKNYENRDVHASLVDATYYFDAFNTDTGPLAEATFLNRSSEISAKYGFADKTLGENFKTWGLGGRYLFRDYDLFVGVDYLEKSFDNIIRYDRITDRTKFEIGYYTNEYSLLTFSYSDSEYDVLSGSNNNGSTSNTDTFLLKYKYLFLLKNDASVSLYGHYAYSDREDSDYEDYHTYSLGSDYYFNKKLSLGLDMAIFNSDDGSNDDSGTRFTIKSSYYITDSFSVYGNLSNVNIEGNTSDVDIVKVGFSTRF